MWGTLGTLQDTGNTTICPGAAGEESALQEQVLLRGGVGERGERTCAGKGQRERERERIPSRLPSISTEPNARPEIGRAHV